MDDAINEQFLSREATTPEDGEPTDLYSFINASVDGAGETDGAAVADGPQHSDAADIYGVLDTPLRSRLGDTLSTYGHETMEEGERTKRVAATAGFLVTQGLDHARLMIFTLPRAFDRVLRIAGEHNWNGYETAIGSGVTVGGIYAAWSWVVGRTLKASIDAYPDTKETFTENHPVFVGTISRAVSGFPTQEEIREDYPESPEGGYDVGPYATRNSILGKAALTLSRGLKGAFLFGITSYVGMGTVNEYSEESQTNLRRTVTAEQSAALGLTAVGVSTLVTHNLFNLAQDVRDAISNGRLLTLASLGVIAAAFGSNWLSRQSTKHKLAKEAKAINAEVVDAVSTETETEPPTLEV